MWHVLVGDALSREHYIFYEATFRFLSVDYQLKILSVDKSLRNLIFCKDFRTSSIKCILARFLYSLSYKGYLSGYLSGSVLSLICDRICGLTF